MADRPVSGAYAYAQYGKETTYGTEAGTIATAFGLDLTTDPTARNNLTRLRGLGNMNATDLVTGSFEGTLGLDFVLGTSHWMAAVLGASASSGSGPYDHTYTEADAPVSITVEEGVDLTTTDSVVKYLGCVFDTVTITCNVGEPVRIRADLVYATESEGTSLDGSPAVDGEDPLVFYHGSVQLPSGSTLAQVQGIDFTITRNIIRSYGLGSRITQNVVPGARDYVFTIRKAFLVASDIKEKFYGTGTGPSTTDVGETAQMILTFTNGLASTAERTVTITLTGVKFDDDAIPKDPTAEIIENATGWGRTCGIVGRDNTATTIFD